MGNRQENQGVFILGIDTGVGKTSACAGLLKMLHGQYKVCYSKPIQISTIMSDDTADLKQMTNLPAESYMESFYSFAEPLSPYMAAKKWGKTIELEPMVTAIKQKQKDGFFMIVEGVGGLLAPLNEKELQIHLIQQLQLPVIVVAEDRVGAINQTLLTLNACREGSIPVLGVLLTKSRRTLGNAECISRFGQVEVLLELDPANDMSKVLGDIASNSRLRQLFHVPQLPL